MNAVNTMVEAWKTVVLKNYVTFSGRARRAEFWWFVLASFIISVIITVVVGIVSDDLAGLLSWVYSLGVLLPSIAVGIRRLHDIGKSGWFLLLGLIPVLGLIVLLVWAAQDSHKGSNAYGPSPKYPQG